MATLAETDKAPILDEDGEQLTSVGYHVSSSDEGVVIIEWQAGPVFAVGISPGLATLSASRNATAETTTLEVEVTGAPFSISLGDPVPR